MPVGLVLTWLTAWSRKTKTIITAMCAGLIVLWIVGAAIQAAIQSLSGGSQTIGDACLVGRWTSTSLQQSDSVTFPGISMAVTGGDGALITFSADGTETDDWTGAAPITGSGGGHKYTFTVRGVAHYKLRAHGDHWTESGPTQQLMESHFVVDGAPKPDQVVQVPPGSGTYTCSGSELTFVTVSPQSATETLKK